MPHTFEIKSEEFRSAVIKIQRRAERQELEEKLTKSFVPTSVIQEMQTTQNQLVFGRRGVGKTHTLKVFLGSKVQEGHLAIYIDCTTFGSGLASDGSVKNVAVRFFSKLIYTIANALMEHVVRMELPPRTSADRCMAILESLSNLATPNSEGETFNYAEINRLAQLFATEIGSAQFYIIIDEWAQIPVMAQPYFAEFLKRSLFAAKGLSIKIGVVDYTYRLAEQIQGNSIGLEKSADIFSDVRMDRHFVWDENKQTVERFFAILLFNHVALEMGLFLDIPDDQKVQSVTGDLFTQDKAFTELTRASEGNARDFLVMFGRALADFKKQETRDRIGVTDVQRAAIAWYREDKFSNITSEKGLEQFLQHLVDDIISKKKSRTFMVPISAIQHPLLRRLFSGRLLHPLNVEWSHPDKPGERYGLVSMDYGTYASFKGTRNEPQDMAFWDTALPNDHLPTDLVPLKTDQRSIRRIVVPTGVLDHFWNMNEKQIF